MADYKNIKGFNIQYLDSDPPNPIEGQMWFNSTTQTLKGAEAGGAPIGTWSSGGSLNTGRYGMAATGTQTDALGAAGSTAPVLVTNTERYNGTSWTELNDVNQSRYAFTGAGTGSASIIIAGYIGTPPPGSTFVESWDGTNWTEIAEVNTGRNSNASFGTQTSAITAAGTSPSTTWSNAVESWNGTSWTEIAEVNTGRYGPIGSGVQTAGIIAGGKTPPLSDVSAIVEQWNGTSWTEVGDINTARGYAGSSAASPNTSTIIFAGENPSNDANTEFWNGTSWTELNNLSTARSTVGGAGVAASAISFGGTPVPSTGTLTEEWNIPDYVVKTFTTS